jgi:Na+/proline symporter
MYLASLGALGASLLLFILIGVRARGSARDADDYLTARNTQSASALGLSFLASGLGAWILFAPPEIGAFVGPVALAGYAVGAALPFLVFAWIGSAIRERLPRGRSIGDYADSRFGPGMRRWIAALSVLYMLCFLTAELTAVGGITALLSELPPAWSVLGVAGATLLYTTVGGLRASIVTDRWQALLLILLLAVVGLALWWASPATLSAVPAAAGAGQAPQPAPLSVQLSVALTLVIAVTAANLFHQGYWQRLWAARDGRALGQGAWLGALTTVAAIALVGGLGLHAAGSGIALGNPPLPFFALVKQAGPWLSLVTLVLAIALVASSVDTLQNGIASLLATETESATVARARWITVLLMIPVVLIALQGLSVLRLFLIADLLCATAVVPVLLGLWRRMSPRAALAGAVAGCVGAVLPGWIDSGSLWQGLIVASFPSSIPTLPPFAGALLLSTIASVGLALVGRPADAIAGPAGGQRQGDRRHG